MSYAIWLHLCKTIRAFRFRLLVVTNLRFSKATFVNTSVVSTLRCAALALSLAALPVMAQNVIKIGEINSYKAQPAFLDPYK